MVLEAKKKKKKKKKQKGKYHIVENDLLVAATDHSCPASHQEFQTGLRAHRLLFLKDFKPQAAIMIAIKIGKSFILSIRLMHHLRLPECYTYFSPHGLYG
jgi:hypothetical protein